uniref:Tripartite motif-containing protein 45-like isoform X1 n=2 Tax=Crassostrea virginica TaxID=6565 RepID=A0A8B8C9X9_CRAVI|nr:tripartite motif-containing protein 45-like isoform X1 [Crassostrea virginica]
MAAKTYSAQHFVECDQCEENPAQYFCKTCPGQLCKECKTDHKNRKITKNHEITELNTKNEAFFGPLFCSDHITKQIQCFCVHCKIPLCTECIIESHNGHAFQKLTKTYKEIQDDLQKKKEKIEEDLLPKYAMLLKTENEKQSDFSKQAQEIEKEIKAHTRQLVRIVKQVGKNAIEDFQAKLHKGLQGIADSEVEIQKQFEKLKQTKDLLSGKMETKPTLSSFEPVNERLLDEFERLPVLPKYHFSKFQPGKIERMIEKKFGKLPILKIDTAKPNEGDSDSDSQEEEVEEEESASEEYESDTTSDESI